MANRSYKFEITWCYKDEGNRPDNIEEITEVASTTVPRAISKLVKTLNEGLEKDDDDFLRASDLLVIDVRSHQLTNGILAYKRANGQPT